MTNAADPSQLEAALEVEAPVDSEGTGLQPPDSIRLTPARSAVFLLGAAVVAAGIWIMRSSDLVNIRLPGGLEDMRRYVHTYREVVVGGGVMLIGAVIAALSVMEALPDRLGNRFMVGSRRGSLRRGLPTLIAGFSGYAIVVLFVVRESKSGWVFLLFLVAMGLVGFGIHRADGGQRGSVLGFAKIDGVILPALAALIISVNLVQLTHWRFSFIGDEGAFFSLGRDIAEGIEHSFFDLTGVYETHPVLDSAYLAGVLKIFGADIVGWRLAEIFALTASALLLYALVLILFGRVPAIVGSVILGTNHYLMAFARIGYNNLHSVFYALLVVLFLVLAWRTKRLLFEFLTGAALGLCIYTFPAALLIWPVAALLAGIKIVRGPTRRGLTGLGLMLAGFTLVVTPGILTTPPVHFLGLVADHGHREMAVEDPIGVARLSLVQSFLVFWVNPQWYRHFVGGPLLDPITAVLFSIGFVLGLVKLRRSDLRLGLFWFGTGLLLIAATNYVTQPLFTRLLVLIPACVIMAAIGVRALESSFEGLRIPAWARNGLILAMTATIPVLNLQQLLVKSPMNLEINQQTITFKALQENPGRVIIEVGEVRDQNLHTTVIRYPWFRDFYEFSTRDELALPPAPVGPEGSLPIYLARDLATVRMLEEKLPPNYVSQVDVYPRGYPQIWLFMPPK